MSLGRIYVVTPQEASRVLEKLGESEFRDLISVVLGSNKEDPNKEKWDLGFSAKDQETLARFVRKVSWLMSDVFYGEKATDVVLARVGEER